MSEKYIDLNSENIYDIVDMAGIYKYISKEGVFYLFPAMPISEHTMKQLSLIYKKRKMSYPDLMSKSIARLLGKKFVQVYADPDEVDLFFLETDTGYFTIDIFLEKSDFEAFDRLAKSQGVDAFDLYKALIKAIDKIDLK